MTHLPPKKNWLGAISGRDLRRAGIVLLVLYVMAGIAYSFLLPAVGRFPDEKEYLALSNHLVHGPGFSMDGVHLTASRSPGYVFFLAALQTFGAGVGVMRVAQFFLMAGTIFLACRLCHQGRRETDLLLVTGLVLLYPVLFYTAATLYPQTLAGFLFIAALAQLLSVKRGLLLDLTTGVTFGALMVVVPTFALTFVLALGAAWLLKLLRWPSALIMILAAGVVISGWTIRNEVEFHQFVPFASNSGNNFLIGNCENTVPYGGSGNVDRTRYWKIAQDRGLDEFQQDRFFQQAAFAWIEQHPGQAAVLYLEKTLNYFNVWNEYAPGSQAEVSFWKQVVMAVSYVVLLALLAWRLLEMKRFPLSAQERLLLSVYVLSSFTLAIFLTRIRFRLPYDYLIIAMIATHLSRRWQLWTGRKAGMGNDV